MFYINSQMWAEALECARRSHPWWNACVGTELQNGSRSALHLAAFRKVKDGLHPEVDELYRVLLQTGGDTVNMRNARGSAPIHEAASCGNLRFLEAAAASGLVGPA